MNRIRKVIKKIRLSLFKGAFIHNPLLTQAAGVFAVIGAATGIRDSFALAVTAGIILLVNEAAAGLLFKRFPRFIRIALYALTGSAVIYFAEPFIIPLTSEGSRALPLYFYLLSVNALTFIRCERFACKNKLRHCIVDAFSSSVGYGAAVLIVGTARELITYGSLFRQGEEVPSVPNGALPFVAFLLLGLLAAAHKAIVIRFYPDEQTDTFSMRSCNEKIALRDPGLGKRKKKDSVSDSSDDYDIISLRTGQRDIQEGEDR